MENIMDKIDTIGKAKKLFADAGFTLLSDEFKSSRERMLCVDAEGYKYLASENQIQGNKLPERYNKFNPYTLENVQHMLDLESEGSVLKTEKYVDSRMRLTFTCEKCGKIIERTWGNVVLRKRFRCNECQSSPKKYDFDYVKKQFASKGYTIIDTEYKGNDVPILCTDSEGYRVRICYSNLISCPRIPNRFSPCYNKENLIYNINHYFELNGLKSKALYCIEDEVINRSMAVMCECECGRKFKTSWMSIAQGKTRCDYCTKTMSNMEFKVRKWLEDNAIRYEFQKRFDDCKDKRRLPFDFYLPEFNCCIEVDGQQHFEPSKFSNESDEYKDFEVRKRHDKIKTEYCLSHNIDLLRLDYNDLRRKTKNYVTILSNKFIKR